MQTKNKWNLQPLFQNDNDPQMKSKRKILEKESYEFINKWKNREDYLRNPKILKQALDEYENWLRNYGSSGDEGYYFWLRSEQEKNNKEIKARINKIEDFSKKIENDIQFFTMRISKIKPELQEKFINSNELKEYKHFLKKSFEEAKHLLTEPEEKIMNLKSATSYSNWVKMTSSFLSKEERKVILENGKKELKNFTEIISLMESRNKRTRDSAAKEFNDILLKHSETAENELNSILQNKKTDDELRHFTRADQARHLSDDIETEIVDILSEEVSKRFNISRRYYKLKAKLLGVKKLKYHERNIDCGKISKRFSYEESVEIVKKAMKKLDKEFFDIFSRFVEKGRIDVYPAKGKEGGAFCAHNLLSQPTYMLLNHTGKIRDVLTMAHELGHGINNELMRKKQNSMNFGTVLSTAEVASTFMEDFATQEILKKTNEKEKIAIMMIKLNEAVTTIFRQIACYKFEQELHNKFREKGYLPKDEIGKLFQKHMTEYMGNYVEQSPGSENWWIYWKHIRNFFYNYSYASGLLISKSMQKSVKKEPEFIEKVKEFLSAGTSDSPKNIFKKMGIDITKREFWTRGILEVEELLKECEKLAGEQK